MPNSQTALDSEYINTNMKHKMWKRSVLNRHLETSKLAESTLEESRRSRRVMEYSLNKVRSTIRVWNSYNDDYHTAVRNLEKRIDHSLEVERKSQIKKQAKIAIQDRL
mmetsp:Transcript_10781/g.12226  ORF Transcript_10781/g.12226 Transcript_10781/m.12226 type:complete len:108 (-) Transcript_10781:130-453(-)